MKINDAVPLAEDPIEKLKTRLFDEDVQAHPRAIAVLGWLTGMTVTEPTIEEFFLLEGGMLMVRHGDDIGAEFWGPLATFLADLRQLLGEMGLNERQVVTVIEQVQQRLA